MDIAQPKDQTNIRFSFKCGYMGEIEYEVNQRGVGSYVVAVREMADEYFHSIFNGTENEWQRDVVKSIGILHRVCEPISDEVVDAFNNWRINEHSRQIDEMQKNPDKYGEINVNDYLPPSIVRGGKYVVGTGWVVNNDAPTPQRKTPIPQMGMHL